MNFTLSFQAKQMTIKATTTKAVFGLVIVRADGGSNRGGYCNTLVLVVDIELKNILKYFKFPDLRVGG